jgi:tetratricopeptide (TPR) repeat protein
MIGTGAPPLSLAIEDGILAAGWCPNVRRTEEARDNLLRVVEKFPEDPIMRYNLACYECQLGRLEQARSWLGKAFELGDPQKMKLMPLDDPDLEPLWKRIGEI